MSVDRRRLLALLGSLEAVVRRSYSGRLLTTLTRDQVKESMPVDGRAVLLQVMAGDEQHSTATWGIPGVGRRTLVMKRSVLAGIVDQAQPLEIVPEPEPAQAAPF